MKKVYFLAISLLFSLALFGAYQPDFSTAGFFQIENAGRKVFSMNPAWRFYKGAVTGAEKTDFDDSAWEVVSLPHGIEYLPTEASGGTNYQGEVWYRKHFTPDNTLKGKKLFLHFEAIMGKSKVFVNGELLKEYFGGYLPVIIDVSSQINWDKENVISVWADNNDDPIYPPGKNQDVLDFTYCGGIYRDCWLITHNNVYITDPNFENEVAGGGLFVSYNNISDKSADVNLKIHIRNQANNNFRGRVEYELLDPQGGKILSTSVSLSIPRGAATEAEKKVSVKSPALWSPENPSLYNLVVKVKDAQGNVVDGYRKRIGIRSVEFKGADGFWLNGKPYPSPLMGANRHQDFAVIGNALPNSLHWRDAKKLRDAGLKLIRNAHYPQDPSFMDACDELGLFVIVNTPGWQFWNDAPVFAERVYNDIRNMVRRDRNHPSVWIWEPILNETRYPADFAKNVFDLINEEYPYPYCYAASDPTSSGSEHYPVIYSHPAFVNGEWQPARNVDPNKTYYTREWGDNVDNWNSHNSSSRVARSWGEVPMLIQANHYASPDYNATSYDVLHKLSRQHVGGALWHSFDHQRGYHPDPFYGGLMDAFRQPKLSYYMFMAQRDNKAGNIIAETGPMVYIAHDMNPFSPKDVTVFSNCDEVRLTVYKGGKTFTYKKDKERKGMPSPAIIFEDVYDFMESKSVAGRRTGIEEAYMLAEGYVDGGLVASHKALISRRPEKLLLWMDNEGVDIEANGSDIVTIIAAVADGDSIIKRLNDYHVKFEIEGEGRLIGDEKTWTNPVAVKWGTAPILVRSTLKSGQIKIKASIALPGSQMPQSAELTIESKPAKLPIIYDAGEAEKISLNSRPASGNSANRPILETDKNRRGALREVEVQQEEFGEQNR